MHSRPAAETGRFHNWRSAEVTVSYSITDKDQTAFSVTDTFTLVGYWDYDELMPVHYINISRDYADDIEAMVNMDVNSSVVSAMAKMAIRLRRRFA